MDFGKIHNQTPPKLKLYLPSNEPGQPGFYEEVDVSYYYSFNMLAVSPKCEPVEGLLQ